ncbi:MAG: hypothetical protein FWB88_00550 [Defluviitaleaceae bacterium]|nr:hypothetical protein [Defluviitaleaceae bacterium]MCL2238987.1 hypothetical protein [Defluviitaleaceae bacterium]
MRVEKSQAFCSVLNRYNESPSPSNDSIQTQRDSTGLDSHLSVRNEVGGLFATSEEDKALVESVRRFLGLTDRDAVRIFVVPKGQNRVPVGSFLQSNTSSPRTQELHINIRSVRGRLRDFEAGIFDPRLTDEERNGLINSMQRSLEAYERALTKEMARLAAMPRSGVIVVEREQ